MPSMIRRLTSAPKPSARVVSYISSRSPAPLGAHPVADAVVAGQVRGGLGRGDHVVGGDPVLGAGQRRPRRSRRRAPRSSPASPRRPRARRRRTPSPASSLGHPEAQALQVLAAGRDDPALDPDRGRVAGVAPLQRRQQQRRVGDVAGQRPALVERGGEGDHPVARDRAVGRLQADDPAERGRLADRAAGVGADRAGGEAAGDGRGRAAGGAAGHAAAVPRVEHRPVGRVLVRGAHRELVHVGLAEHAGAGGVEAPHRGRRVGRPVALEDARAGRGRRRPRCRRCP